MLAGTIGSRPVGTPANARAREYIVDQLRQIGFDVRVQETDARRHELGRTARVSNIIGILPGEKPDAIGLVAHYDSSADAPGATDDGLGVAVTLEAARVLSAGARRQWTLMALLTDGEEAGLMGAAGLVTDREVMNRLRAYLNIESIGSSGTAVLFETGPANAWLVSPWARSAPHPRGGSYGIEVYRRLPNDTDFSILKTREIPGLNFAAVGDSYAYHTARDTPERLSRQTIRTTGENVVAVATRLQQMDITLRTAEWPTFMDINATTAVTYGPSLMGTLSMLALVTGVIGWVRVTAVALRLNGVWRLILSIVWAWIGAVAVAASMAGAPPMRTGLEAMRLGGVIYIVPFFFVLNPALIGEGPALEVIVVFLCAMIGVWLLSSALQAYVAWFGPFPYTPLGYLMRMILGLAALAIASPAGGVFGINAVELTIGGYIVALLPLAYLWRLGRLAPA